MFQSYIDLNIKCLSPPPFSGFRKLTIAGLKSRVQPGCGLVRVVDVVNFSLLRYSLFPAFRKGSWGITNQNTIKCFAYVAFK